MSSQQDIKAVFIPYTLNGEPNTTSYSSAAVIDHLEERSIGESEIDDSGLEDIKKELSQTYHEETGDMPIIEEINEYNFPYRHVVQARFKEGIGLYGDADIIDGALENGKDVGEFKVFS